MKLFFAVVAVLMAVSAVSAADAPAPSPTSDAAVTAVFVPTAVASLVALAFGLLF